MTTTLLPKEQVDVLRSIGDAANVLIALWMIDQRYPGRSTTAKELGNIFGKDERSIDKRLVSLCASDRVAKHGVGYVLLEGGRALLLASTPSLDVGIAPELTDDFDQALALSPDPAQAPQAQALSPEIITVEATETSPDNARTMRALLEEDNTLLNSSDNNSSSSDSSTQNAQRPSLKPTTLEILDATHLLFDKTMTTAGMEHKPRRLVIGWVAQAWDQRRFLRSPQGLIYTRLKADQMPQQKYYDHPREYLPENYLVALGLAKPAVQPVEPETEPEPQFPDVGISEGDDSIRAIIPGSNRTPAEAWQFVLDYLRNDMHAAPFETWVKDTTAVHFDGKTVFIGARNSYTCEWLSGRLQTTVERLLVGILNRSVNVEFVVKDGER